MGPAPASRLPVKELADSNSPLPVLTVDDLVAAVIHSGEPPDGPGVAASCHASVEEVDPLLSQAVDDGYLSRDEDPETGRITFSPTRAGDVHHHTGD